MEPDRSNTPAFCHSEANVIVRVLASTVMWLILLAVHVVCLLRPRTKGSRPRQGNGRQGLRVLALGTFYHRNWLESHLQPLARSQAVEELTVVTGDDWGPEYGIRWRIPSRWLQRIAGLHGSRALSALHEAVTRRPDVVIGYFICPNALLALALARLVGARSCYQMCGGPREIMHAGAGTGNPWLQRMLPRYPWLKSFMYRAVNEFDLIVVRGHRAEAFCRQEFSMPDVRIITGSVNLNRFRPDPSEQPVYGVITACRMDPVKRLDVLLGAVAEVRCEHPDIRAAILGDGPERAGLEALAKQLGVDDCVDFLGKQQDVESYYRRSKLFLMPSDDEGLAIALAEAMATGLPGIVSNVGDLGELVKDRRNGLLLEPGSVPAFAEAIGELLNNEPLRERWARQAARDAEALCGLPAVTHRWTCAFDAICQTETSPRTEPRCSESVRDEARATEAAEACGSGQRI